MAKEIITKSRIKLMTLPALNIGRVGLVWWLKKEEKNTWYAWLSIRRFCFWGSNMQYTQHPSYWRILNIPTSMSQRKPYKYWEIVRLCQCQASYYIARLNRPLCTRVQTIESMGLYFLWLFTFHFTCSAQKLLWYVGRFK